MSKDVDDIKIKPILTFSVGGKRLTHRQLEALALVQSLSSQTQASKELGIATPVLHRHIKKAEEKLGVSLVTSTATGTKLTGLGERIVDEFGRYKARVSRHDKFTIGCTPITMEAVLEAASEVEGEKHIFDIYIGDDFLNERLLRLGELDVVIFDDPVNVYIHEERGHYFELFHDTLMHCDRGDEYAKYRYGAQRLGFKHLEFSNIKYRIVRLVSDADSLFDSGLSFFLNKSIALKMDRPDVHLVSIKELNHAIMTLLVRDDPVLDELLDRIEIRYELYA